MSLLLSIDTATKVCSVALHQEGKLLASQHLHIDKSHSGLLTVLIKNVVQHSGYQLSELTGVAVSEGPGSYTGLRIGVSTAKGLGFSLDVPIVVVNTLEAMAHGMRKFAEEGVLLCPMIDARRMEVYCLLMDSTGEVVVPAMPKIIDKDSFKEELQANKMYFFGDGAAKVESLLGGSGNARFIPDIVPSAVQVGELGWRKLNFGDFADLAYFEPFYLKEFHSPVKK